MTGKTTEISVLGELEVRQNGRVLPLPPSKKTRALLAYLVLTGRPHLRQALCDLFWEGPYDPRGALRWSLSRIRKLVDDADVKRLQANRERVAFEQNGATVDLEEVRAALSQGLEHTPVEHLKAATQVFRGELLDGLDLPDCYQYNGWCIAQRETARKLRLSILDTVVERLADPEEKLAFARERVAVDPLSEAAHIEVMNILSVLGRKQDARAQYETCCKILKEAFAADPSEKLRRTLEQVGATTVSPSPVAAPPEEPGHAIGIPKPDGPLIGRQSEKHLLEELVRTASAGQIAHTLILSGEPGLGKSRLLTELAANMSRSGGTVMAGRAYEAESARPFGPWFDAFTGVSPDHIPPSLRQDLAPLMPRLEEGGQLPPDRNRLFNAVAQFLANRAEKQPVLVTMDDLQWFDDGSLALIHYIARGLDGCGRVMVAATVRPGELIDNPAARKTLRTLARENRLHELALAPLGEVDTVTLAHTVAKGLDGHRVFTESRGNPLFVLEVASAMARGGDNSLPKGVETLIEDRLSRVSERAHAVLPWAAAVGKPFDPELIIQAAGHHGGTLLEALEELEGRAILTAFPDGKYNFSHDLLRRTVYRGLSEPRRRLLHRQLARALTTLTEIDPELAGAWVYHAEQGGDLGLLARACVAAGERSLRLFAPGDALQLADKGLRHVSNLPEALRIGESIALLRIRILAASSAGLTHPPEHKDLLQTTILEAERSGGKADAATGHYLMSVVHEDEGQMENARTAALRAAEAGRSADAATAAPQLANTARCLIQLEKDVPRVRALLDEARALFDLARPENAELFWGQGLLARWDGDEERAMECLLTALSLARSTEDTWRECNCLAWLTTLAFERGKAADVYRYADMLTTLAARMGEGAKGSHAKALSALTDRAYGNKKEPDGIDSILAHLRLEDNKSLLAYMLNESARLELAAVNPEQARCLAEEALEVARAIQRPSEIACARAILAESAHELGDQKSATMYLDATSPGEWDPGIVSARARRALARAGKRIGYRRFDDD